MAGTLVYADNPGSIPATYSLPADSGVRLESVSALFNGSGASGDFYPCLSVYSQDNKLIGRYFPGTALSAGDVAEVTFATFLGSSGASSSVSFSREGWFKNNIAVASGDSEHFDFAGAFTEGDDLFDDHGGADYPTVREPGMYWIGAFCQLDSAAEAGATGSVLITIGPDISGSFAWPRIDPVQTYPLDWSSSSGSLGATWYLGAGWQINCTVFNEASVSKNFDVQVWAQRVA